MFSLRILKKLKEYSKLYFVVIRNLKKGVEKMSKAKDIIQDAIDKYLKDMVEEEVDLSKITKKI